MSHEALDPSLAAHLERIRRYLRGAGIEQIPPGRTDLRRALAAFMDIRAPALLDRWLEDIGVALEIPRADWPGIKADHLAAVGRWTKHIADPGNIETYLFLSRHTRRGFISHFPASRFLVAQMRFVHLLAEDLRREYAHDPERAALLLRLLVQEFEERVLHITDFFVQGREEELLDQEASYQRAIEYSPACILMVDATHGTVFGANQVAERLLGWSRDELAARFPGVLLTVDLAEFARHSLDPRLTVAEGDRPYYDGLVFHAYAGPAALPVGGGGRYDRLFGLLGAELPAVGFSLNLERTLEAGGAP